MPTREWSCIPRPKVTGSLNIQECTYLMSLIYLLYISHLFQNTIFYFITFDIPYIVYVDQRVIFFISVPDTRWLLVHSMLWVGTPILGHGREVPWWWTSFWGFSIWLGPYFIPQHDPIDPLFLQNWFASITFSSRDTRI